MSEERVLQIVRQFPENGLKQVLSSPGNLRDLLALAKAKMLPRFVFEGMQIDPTTYITAEYRHISSDLVLTVTLLPSQKGRRKKRLTLTILIELQSQPDRLMMLRVLEYLVQVWKGQIKQYGQKHKSLASVKLRPVLPVVLHTGSFSWKQMGTLLDLMDDAEDFQEVIPAFKPLFVSLPDRTEEELEQQGGYLGQVLALTRARKDKRTAFAQRLAQTVNKVQELKGDERLRRLELLSYVEAFVYHSREQSEHQMLRQRIDAVLKEEARLEVDMVRQTLADVHRLEGAVATARETLLRQLQLCYGELSVPHRQAIEGTTDLAVLNSWLDRFATTDDLDSIGIVPSS